MRVPRRCGRAALRLAAAAAAAVVLVVVTFAGASERFGVGADVDAGDVRGVRGGVEEVDGGVGGEDAAAAVVAAEAAAGLSMRRNASGGDLRVSTAHRRRHRGRIHPVARARLCSLGWVRTTSAPRVGKGVSGRCGQRHARAGRSQPSHVARRPEMEGWSSASSLASRVASQSAARSSSPSSSRVIVTASTTRSDRGGRLKRCAGCADRRVGGCRCLCQPWGFGLSARRCFRGRAESSARAAPRPTVARAVTPETRASDATRPRDARGRGGDGARGGTRARVERRRASPRFVG